MTTASQTRTHPDGLIPAARHALHVGDQSLSTCFVDIGIAQPPRILAERLEYQSPLICGDHQHLRINDALTRIAGATP
jgi:hypothetical protein